MSRAILALFLLCACREAPKDTGTGETAPPVDDTQVDTQLDTQAEDADGDGFASDVDCDDANAAINPEAEETCDGIDNDCDGLTDDADDAVTGTSPWYEDADSDGYGNPASSRDACEAPERHVADDTDCNDLNAAYHPSAEESDCTDPEDYNCDGSVGYADEDGDGFAACEECDDTVASSNPLAFEICDGADNDCDGTTDEDDAVDTTSWYADGDTDGFGDPSTTQDACNAPSGYVADNTDCDDASADSHPGAAETCDSADNDCDGLVDADDPDLTGATVFYADADGDGYGGQQFQQSACTAPTGYVSTSDDCDDLDPTSYPGASETCDLADNDCDGTVDEGVGSTWYQDSDGDGYGNGSVSQEACEAPSGFVGNPLDCDDFSASSSPASYEVCDGVDNDCDGVIDEDDAINASTFYADTDGDGYGSSASSSTACSAPSNQASNDRDCDDSNSAVNPGASEVCDSIDNDCDGSVDESDAVDAATWYIDADADGYGEATSWILACSQPLGYVADASDCDDADGSSTYTAVDADCDTVLTADDCDDADAASTTVATDADCDTVLTADDCDDADAASTTVATDADCDGSLTAADCDDADDNAYPGNQEVCDGVDNNCDGTLDENMDGAEQSCPGTSCQTLLSDGYSTGDGRYWIDPDGDGSDAFEVYCDMTTDGGGWIGVRISNDCAGVNSFWFSKYSSVAAQQTAHGSIGDQLDWNQLAQISNQSELCSTFDWVVPSGYNIQQNQPVVYEMVGDSTVTYSNADIEDIRTVITEIHTGTRLWTHTNDDDGCNPNGEIYIRLDSGGTPFHLTSFTSGDQSSTWRKYDQTDVPSPGYLLPTYYDWGDYDTAGCSGGVDHASWGYEADQVLVR